MNTDSQCQPKTQDSAIWWFCCQMYFRSLLIIDIILVVVILFFSMVLIVGVVANLTNSDRVLHWWSIPVMFLWLTVLSMIAAPVFSWRSKWYASRIESWFQFKYRRDL